MSEQAPAESPKAPAASTGKTRKKRGEGIEAQRVNTRLQGFDLEKSEAWKTIQHQFTVGVTHTELKSIAQILCDQLTIKLDRDASRDNRVLVKWFDENWAKIKPILHTIHLRDDHDNVIGA